MNLADILIGMLLLHVIEFFEVRAKATLNKLLRGPSLRLRCSPYFRTVALLDANSNRSLHLFSAALIWQDMGNRGVGVRTGYTGYMREKIRVCTDQFRLHTWFFHHCL
jgi:hypothetical protein